MHRAWTFIAAIGLCSQATAAQLSAPSISSMLPGVSKMSLGNAVGVLKYCEQKGLVSSSSAEAVLDQIKTKPDAKSAEYLAGAAGQIHGDAGKNFSIAQAPGYLQSQACNVVLEQVKTLRPPL